MAIKSTVVGEKPKSPEWMFPCLGRSKNGTIVLFSAHGFGTTLIGCNVGMYDSGWTMAAFTPLDPSEVVQLQNKG